MAGTGVAALSRGGASPSPCFGANVRLSDRVRQAGFEPTTFGSGGGTGQRPPTLAVVVSGTYASRVSASASQRRPRCYHRCYRGSLLRRCVGAAPPCTCIRSAARDGEGSQCGVPAALHQRVQQFLRVSQVGGVEPLSEPIVDRCEHVSRLVFLPLTLPQARRAHGCPQLKRLR